MTVWLEPARAGQLQRAAEWLLEGVPVALPTETVYGLAGLAADENALSKIFALKARPHFDPLIVHVLDADHALSLVSDASSLHHILMERFWPGPLTLLFEKNRLVPDLCTAGTSLVGLRSPSNPVFRRVLQLTGKALAAPSANRFGRISPTSARDVIDELGPWGLEAVVDGGRSQWGIESTVVKIPSNDEIQILRPGALSEEMLREALGHAVRVTRGATATPGPGAATEAPGLLLSHYAPRTPLHYVNDSALERWRGRDLSRFAFLSVFPEKVARWSSLRWGRSEVLCPRHSDLAAAAALFRAMRELDALGFEGIVARGESGGGLLPAINDRLQRASYSTGGPVPDQGLLVNGEVADFGEES